MILLLTPSTPGQLVVAHDAPLTRASWAKHGTRAFYLSPAVNHYRCHNVFLPLSNSYRVCQTLDHFPDPLFSFEDTSAPLPQNPTFIDYNTLDLEIPDPPSPNPNPNPTPYPPVPPTVSPGTASVPPATFPRSARALPPIPSHRLAPHLSPDALGRFTCPPHRRPRSRS